MARDKSDWHEQVEFSEIYFQETMKCRDAQRMDDLVGWKNAFLSKVSLTIGVFPKKEDKEQIDEWREKVLKTAYNLCKLESIERSRSGLSSYYLVVDDSPMVVDAKDKLRKELYEAEAFLDIKVNRKMPFLNIRERGSLKGF